jgi:NADH:ubiquinone oxidoreductase subunit 3 (subunit A)
METMTVLAVLAIIIIVSTLYFLKDTITEALSGGKSFAPAELKNFSSGRKSKPTDREKINKNKLLILIIDLLSILLVAFIVYLIFKKLLSPIL